MKARIARRWLAAHWTDGFFDANLEPDVQLVFMTTGDENRRVVLLDPGFGGVPPMAFYESSGTGGSGARKGNWVPFYGVVVLYPELGGQIWFAKHPGGKVPPEHSLEGRIARWLSRNLKQSTSFSVDLGKTQLGKLTLGEIRDLFDEIAKVNRHLSKVVTSPEAKKARGEGYIIGGAGETGKPGWWTFKDLLDHYGITRDRAKAYKAETGKPYLDLKVLEVRELSKARGWKP